MTFGLGDINYTGFLAPPAGGPVTGGIGHSISFPNATDKKLGTQKWSAPGGPPRTNLSELVGLNC